MTKILSLLIAGASAFGLASCEPAAANYQLPEVKVPQGGVQQDAFSLNLFKAMVAESQSGTNVTVSPYSVVAALNLVRSGAVGETRAEMDAVLGSLDLAKLQAVAQSGSLTLNTAERVYLEKTLAVKEAYLKFLPAGSAEQVDFKGNADGVRAGINKWVAGKTNQLIKDLLGADAVNAATDLVAVNAIYMRAPWLLPFKPEDTQARTFYKHAAIAGAAVEQEVPFMNQNARYRTIMTPDLVAIACFYGAQQESERAMCWVAILPPQNVPARDWVAALTPEKLASIRQQLATAREKSLDLSMPKLKLEPPTFNLNKALQSMGMKTAFSAAADFSGIADASLFISSVLQKCYVSWDEEGTEAAAATAVMMQRSMPPRVVLNRAFVWMIGDLTSDAPPYFMGLVEEVQ